MRFLLLFLVALLASCANEASDADVLSESFEGLARVKSAEDSVKLEGVNLTVRFTYDFYIGEHEVTAEEFGSVNGEKISAKESDLPVVDVTFYDAVLYANALSQNVKLDSVYSYTAVNRDNDDHVIFLENLKTDFTRNGYRLPTEAEWVYAASKGWNPKKNAWTADNSDYQIHSVCSIGENDLGICDMAGNVLEWTNDRLSTLADSTVVNYAGASSPNALNEIVVKGGSFRNAAANTTLKSRGDVYTVTPAMRAAYVGFRLVRGAMLQTNYASVNEAKENYNVKVLASSAQMQSQLGIYRTKLVFRDDETGRLAYVNFNGASPQVVEMKTEEEVYHPTISPDGNWVAYSTMPEGISGKSAVYVRRLDALDSHQVKIDVESAAIPRWRVVGADTQIVYVTSAGNNLEDAAWKQESTWSVSFANGKFGKPEKLFNGTFNGGVSGDGQLAVTGARLLRANVNGKTETWYGGEQACNTSLSDSTKQTLFLDFGGTLGQEFAGSSYNAHEQILIADSTGKLIQTILAPKGYTFDHSEWVRRNPHFAVATLTNGDGAHSKIVLVNTVDSNVTEIAEGVELWHPDLWVNQINSSDVALNLDSAGVYYLEGDVWEKKLLAIKLQSFWKFKDSVEYAFVGSSRVEDGIDPSEISSGYALNLGYPGNDFASTAHFVSNYVLNHSPKLKAVIISLDFGLWQNTTQYMNFMYSNRGYIYDENHAYWENAYPPYFDEVVQSANPISLEDYSPYLKGQGYIPKTTAGWGAALVESDSLWSEDESRFEFQFAVLEDLIQKIEEKNVYLVGVIFPQNPKYKETGSWGRYGPQRSKMGAIRKRLNELSELHPRFIVFNENKMGNHDYPDAMAMNTDHLSAPGAKQISSRLDSLFQMCK